MRKTQNSLDAAFKTSELSTIGSAISAMIFATDNVNAFARKAGVDRTTLYRGFKRKPRLDLVLKVLRAADFKLVIVDHPKRGTKTSLISKRLSGPFETAEITFVTKALRETLRDQNVLMFAEKANMDRAGLYHSFTAPRVPKLGTVLSFLKALQVRLAVAPLPDR